MNKEGAVDMWPASRAEVACLVDVVVEGKMKSEVAVHQNRCQDHLHVEEN